MTLLLTKIGEEFKTSSRQERQGRREIHRKDSAVSIFLAPLATFARDFFYTGNVGLRM